MRFPSGPGDPHIPDTEVASLKVEIPAVPIREPGIPSTSRNSKDRAAPNHAARALLQAERDALEYIPPPVRSLRPSRCPVKCRASAGCRETSVQVRRSASVSTPAADWACCSAEDGSLVPLRDSGTAAKALSFR